MSRSLIWIMLAGMLTGLAIEASAQESIATVRTHQGATLRMGDPSLEVSYTIGELKDKNGESQGSQTITNFQMPAGGPGEQSATGYSAAGGAAGEKAPPLLHGHARAGGMTASKDGVEIRVDWERIRAISFARTPAPSAGLPPYIPQYRYSASITLTNGERIDADYVNLGGTILKGTTPNGHVDIPWQDVAHIVFDR